MFALHAIQSFFGDCLLLEFGTPAQPRYALIDGGPARTYADHLESVLRGLKQDGHDLELTVLSHVDTDHVTGLLDYVSELGGPNGALLPATAALWHNSFGRALDPNNVLAPRLEAMTQGVNSLQLARTGATVNGISDGAALRVRALAHGILLNPGFPGDLITVDQAGPPWTSGNLELTVVGPTQANLDELRQQWETWLDAHEDETDPLVLANSDRSVPNLSSIMVLARADGRSLLLTGDGRSDHLLQGLAQANLLDATGGLHVDVLKLPHHGSDRNVTKKFFKKVTADTYVASADGTNDNPDLATLIWIVEAAREAGRPVTLAFTNETDATGRIVAEYPPADYGYQVVFRPAAEHALRVELAP